LNKAKLTEGDFMLVMTQIAWWDKRHQKCKIRGSGAGDDHVVQFKRDKNGKLDRNGDYHEARKKLKVKFEQEGCFGLGVAVLQVKTPPGGNEIEPVGGRLRLFDYSTKVMISIDDRNTKRTTEISRVKSLRATHPWVQCRREEGQIFLDDSIKSLKNVAKMTAEKLEPHGLVTVQNLRDAADDRLKEIADKKLGRGTSLRCLMQLSNAIKSSCALVGEPRCTRQSFRRLPETWQSIYCKVW
jgi:hypothetical protein